MEKVGTEKQGMLKGRYILLKIETSHNLTINNLIKFKGWFYWNIVDYIDKTQ
jgi:hypothetical protein